ncbi:MAG: DNA-binding protein [Flavobacteriales bacterium]|nr:MAG: DNA-binding protein [Flavobacteriales bacterium]
MNVITIESEVFKSLQNHLEAINNKLDKELCKTPLSELWLDNQDVIELLHCSKRTLQNYRDSGKLSYSKVGAKLYYKANDIEVLLNNHYLKANAK